MDPTRRDFLTALGGAALGAGPLASDALAAQLAQTHAHANVRGGGPAPTGVPLTSANLAPWAKDFIEGIYTGPDGRVSDGCGCIVEGDSITSEVNSGFESRYFMGMRDTWRPLAWQGWSSTLGSDAIVSPLFVVPNAYRSVQLFGHQRDLRRWYQGAAPSAGPSWYYTWFAQEPPGNAIIRFDTFAARASGFPSGLPWLRGAVRFEFGYVATPNSLRDLLCVGYRRVGTQFIEVSRISTGIDFTAPSPQIRTFTLDIPAGDGEPIFWLYAGNAQTQGRELITSSIRLLRNDGVARGTLVGWTGVGGTKSRDLLDPTYQNMSRLSEYARDHNNAHLWLVQIGTNDGGAEWQAFPQFLNVFLAQRRIAASVNGRRARFLFVVPYLGVLDEPAKQLFLRQTLEARARTDRDVAFLDLSSMSPTGPNASGLLLADGVHPSPAGARAYTMAIWSALKAAYDAVYQGSEGLPVERLRPFPMPEPR